MLSKGDEMKKKKRKRVTGAGRQRLVPGELCVQFSVTLTQANVNFLRRIGHGNVSFGVRIALDAYKKGGERG